MSPQDRQRLIDKYGIGRSPNPDDPIVQAMLDTERIADAAWGRDNTPLFDPSWCPAMWDRANRAMHELRMRIALPEDDPDRIHLESHDYDGLDVSELPHDALVMWAVGTGRAHCGRPDRSTQRPTNRVDWFTCALQLAQQIDDYWHYGGDDNSRYAADYELRCNINIAKDCTCPLSPDVNDFGGGTTRTMPVRRGQFLLLFRCCRVCEELAGQLAENNFQTSLKIAELEAREDWPPSGTQ